MAGQAGQNAGGRGRLSCVLADANAAVIDALPRLLAQHEIIVAATAADGDEAMAAISRHKPTVAILSSMMGGLPVVEIARQAPETRVILYTSYQAREQLLEELDAGVAGIVLKEAPLDDLIRAIDVTQSGGTYIDPLLAGRFITTHGPRMLSPRERGVLQLLADGHGYEAISQQLSIAPDTVRSHIRNAIRKLNSHSRTHAVAEALRRELIT